VQFRYTLSKGAHTRANRAVLNKDKAHWVGYGSVALFLLLFLAMNIYESLAGREAHWHLFAGFAAATAAAVAIGQWLVPYDSVRTLHQESRLAGKEVVLTVTADGLSTEVDGASAHNPWSVFLEVLETDEFFLFFHMKRAAFVLPISAVDPAQRPALREVLRSKIHGRVSLSEDG
jgi:hypothetical protein